MRCNLLLFAVLLSAVSGLRSSSNFQILNDVLSGDLSSINNNNNNINTKETTIQPLTSSSTNSIITTTPLKLGTAAGVDLSTTTTTTLQPAFIANSETPAPAKEPEELSTELPAPQQGSQLIEQTVDETEDSFDSKRPLIRYDQRQEGQYNIRADLENFMIVLIPPSASSGLGLLDLLTKSANRHAVKSKRKHLSPLLKAQGSFNRYRQNVKSGGIGQSFNYLNRNPDGLHSYDNHVLSVQPTLGGISSRASDYIEGRTPYHVDITANDDEHQRLHADQVEVIPPPSYPYPHLIRPYYHLEAEPAVIPPLTELNNPSHTAGAFLETYNQLLATGLKGKSKTGSSISSSSSSSLQSDNNGRNIGNSGSDGYYRVSRSVPDNDFLETNRVTSKNSLHYNEPRQTNIPIYRSEFSFGASHRYPPIDVPQYAFANEQSRSVNLESTDDNGIQNLSNDGHIGEIIIPPIGADEIDLDSSMLINADVKALLSDGMERCAPGRRRDSYGVCREIEGY